MLGYVHGIDVSKYQGTIDWKQVKASGVEFAMLKTVSTNSHFGGIYIDQMFERNYRECKRLGIPVGVYYYTYAQNRATADAELTMFKRAVSGKTFEYPLVVDVEDNLLRPLSADALTDLVVYALETIESWGNKAMLYTYTNYKNTELNMARLSAYDLWLADYRGKRPTAPHTIWQYTSSGEVAGIAGRVDMNISYKDYGKEKPMNFTSVFKELVVTSAEKPSCEVFSQPDVNTAIGKLPLATVLPVTGMGDTVTISGMTGVWCEVKFEGDIAYVLALPDRCTIRDPGIGPVEPPKPVEGKLTITGANDWQKHILLGLCGKWGLSVE